MGDDRLLDILVEIEEDVLDEMKLPRDSMSFMFSIIKGAREGIVVTNPDMIFTENIKDRFRELMLERLW